ncbi:MAG TPA: hypothetical protein VF469_36875 [Kofleriaceae bacterium]
MSFDRGDGTGELATDDGVSVRFGASACKGFFPAPGMAVWLIAVVPHPRGTGYRASVVNTTGVIERTNLDDAREATQRAAERREREVQLLQRHSLDPERGPHWETLVSLPQERRAALAADLMELKRTSHLFERLFEDLVTLAPELFHPWLTDLDWRGEPESLAWVRAPWTNVTFAPQILEAGTAVGALRDPVPVGTVGPGLELARRDRAPSNEVGAAALVLARSGCPEAIAALERWLRSGCVQPEEVEDLFAAAGAGWSFHRGALRQLWGHRPAYRVRTTADGPVRQFVTTKMQCARCGAPLIELFQGAPRELVPFPLFTCLGCSMSVDSYVVEVNANDEPKQRWSEWFKRRKEPSLHSMPAPAAVALEPALLAVPWDAGGDQLNRLGGAPSWNPVKGPLYGGLSCPRCKVPMEFLAQFPDPEDSDSSLPDMYYVAGCVSCRVASTAYQKS